VVLGHRCWKEQSRNPESVPTYEMIAKLPQESPCRMFYANNGVQGIGTWCHFEPIYGSGGPLSSWLSVVESFDSPLYYTSAKLEGIREITPCLHWKLDWHRSDIIVGFLLTYTDGRQRCVGEVRLDQLGAPQKVTSETMWIGCTAKGDSINYDIPTLGCSSKICSVGFLDPTSHSGVERSSVKGPGDKHKSKPGCERCNECSRTKYTMIPLRGRLDWATSDFGYSWSHHEDSEPEDEMRSVLHHHAASGTQRLEPVSRRISVVVGACLDGNITTYE
jgi:hypothetical protein